MTNNRMTNVGVTDQGVTPLTERTFSTIDRN